MTESLVVIVVGLVLIAAGALLGLKFGVAAPLLLTAVGVGASFLPMFTDISIEPEWVLEGLLPPLLYSASVAMPSMNFRREFGAISGLSIALVVATSLALGIFFMFAIPGLGFAWGVALGAIISPTDAVATSIIRQAPVSKRVMALLDGESLLNDATALVLLRTAIVATASAFSIWGMVGTFAWSVAVAAVVGVIVGALNLAVRARISDPAVNTVLSFTVPFLASIPTDLLGGSGLVAAVVAGLATGFRAPRELSPESRLSDTQNWRTVELVLEGAVFLTMGLQIKTIVAAVVDLHGNVILACLVALGALVLTLLIRAGYVTALLGLLRRRARRRARTQPRLQDIQEKMTTDEGRQLALDRLNTRPGRPRTVRDLDRFMTRITRSLADVDYFLRQPLGWRDGSIVVWAGMRGAVTVAAAQTLPESTPQRSVLVLIAVVVALASLVVQGGTIGALVGHLTGSSETDDEDEQTTAQRRRLRELLRAASETVPNSSSTGHRSPDMGQPPTEKAHHVAVLNAQRDALLDARDDGTFDAELLEDELANLDAAQIAIEMREREVG